MKFEGWDCLTMSYFLLQKLEQRGLEGQLVVGSTPAFDDDVAVLVEGMYVSTVPAFDQAFFEPRRVLPGKEAEALLSHEEAVGISVSDVKAYLCLYAHLLCGHLIDT